MSGLPQMYAIEFSGVSRNSSSARGRTASVRPIQPSQPAFAGSPARETVGTYSTGYSPVPLPVFQQVAITQVGDIRDAVDEDRPARPTLRRSAFIIETKGALPVPVEMKMCVRSSPSSSVKRPLGPIIRMPWPSGSRHRSGVNAPPWTRRT